MAQVNKSLGIFLAFHLFWPILSNSNRHCQWQPFDHCASQLPRRDSNSGRYVRDSNAFQLAETFTVAIYSIENCECDFKRFISSTSIKKPMAVKLDS